MTTIIAFCLYLFKCWALSNENEPCLHAWFSCYRCRLLFSLHPPPSSCPIIARSLSLSLFLHIHLYFSASISVLLCIVSHLSDIEHYPPYDTYYHRSQNHDDFAFLLCLHSHVIELTSDNKLPKIKFFLLRSFAFFLSSPISVYLALSLSASVNHIYHGICMESAWNKAI